MKRNEQKTTMKMIYLATIMGTTMLFAVPTTSRASLITGNIGFTGEAQFDTSSASTATMVTDWFNTQVLGVSGTFSSVANGTTAMFAHPWHFNTTSPLDPFWTAGGFSFEMLSSHIVTQGSGAVHVAGVGIVNGPGYDPTQMNWDFSSQNPEVNSHGWTFSASTATASSAVPEPSTVVAGVLMLLPFGVSTMRILRKKKIS